MDSSRPRRRPTSPLARRQRDKTKKPQKPQSIGRLSPSRSLGKLAIVFFPKAFFALPLLRRRRDRWRVCRRRDLINENVLLLPERSFCRPEDSRSEAFLSIFLCVFASERSLFVAVEIVQTNEETIVRANEVVRLSRRHTHRQTQREPFAIRSNGNNRAKPKGDDKHCATSRAKLMCFRTPTICPFKTIGSYLTSGAQVHLLLLVLLLLSLFGPFYLLMAPESKLAGGAAEAFTLFMSVCMMSRLAADSANIYTTRTLALSSQSQTVSIGLGQQ